MVMMTFNFKDFAFKNERKLDFEFLILLLYVKLRCEIARLVKLRILMECTHNKQNHRVLGKCRKNRVKRANREVSVKASAQDTCLRFECLENQMINAHAQQSFHFNDKQLNKKCHHYS